MPASEPHDQPWLVYTISTPLIGICDTNNFVATSFGRPLSSSRPHGSTSKKATRPIPSRGRPGTKTLSDTLNNQPLMAAQIQPKLNQILGDFEKQFEKSLPPLPTSQAREESIDRQLNDVLVAQKTTTEHGEVGLGTYDPVIDRLSKGLHGLISEAVDEFRSLSEHRSLFEIGDRETGEAVVHSLVERYIVEQVHDMVLFPEICLLKEAEDRELDLLLKSLADVDFGQLGICGVVDANSRLQMTLKLDEAVELFKKIGVAGSPHQMLEVVTECQIALAESTASKDASNIDEMASSQQLLAERRTIIMQVDADFLVSLFLMVIIRSGVKHLRARLCYMRNFIFSDDTESGEKGYALSTYEAVLYYVVHDSASLRYSSQHNKKLWQAVKRGSVEDVKKMLDSGLYKNTEPANDCGMDSTTNGCYVGDCLLKNDRNTIEGSHSPDCEPSVLHGVEPETEPAASSINGTDGTDKSRPKSCSFSGSFVGSRKMKSWTKKVSMETRSTSSVSDNSFDVSLDFDQITGYPSTSDLTKEKLCQTRNAQGESLLMMALRHKQITLVQYFLEHQQDFTLEHILQDVDNSGTTLLSAAIQIEQSALIGILLNCLQGAGCDDTRLRDYLRKQDLQGRSVAHYLFHQPLVIPQLADKLPWTLKDKNGQTPLFALCRSYDHENYIDMVNQATNIVVKWQADGEPLHVDDHVDNKGNTLFHIVREPHLLQMLLKSSDGDVNAANVRKFTPLMTASKYGRIDTVRALFKDDRVDLLAKDFRGLTAVDLAKDDEVRNEIDDLVLLSTLPLADSSVTRIVRALFIEDGTIQLVLKTATPSQNRTVTVTTCRRSLTDFESLVRWLKVELPASWLPSLPCSHSPFAIPSRPSRAVTFNIQSQLNNFLKSLLSHATFSTHELVWEFFLVPDVDSNMLSERTRLKAQARTERVIEEFSTVTDVEAIKGFIDHASRTVHGIQQTLARVAWDASKVRFAQADVGDATEIATVTFSALQFPPKGCSVALSKYVKTLSQSDSAPIVEFTYELLALASAASAIFVALGRPKNLMGSMTACHRAISRHRHQTTKRSDRWPLGLLEVTRQTMRQESDEKIHKAESQLMTLGKELRYTQQIIANELGGWEEARVKIARSALKKLAQRTVIVERARLDGLKRAMRELRPNEGNVSPNETPDDSAKENV